MKGNISSALFAVLLLIAVLLACGGSTDESDKADKLVAQANTAVQDYKKYLTDANEKVKRMVQMKVSQLAEAKTLANEAIGLYDRAEDKLKEAASKLEEASKLKIDDGYKQYLTLEVKANNKRAEAIEAYKGVPQGLIDSQSRESFMSREDAAVRKFEQLDKEADDLSAQADKISKIKRDTIK